MVAIAAAMSSIAVGSLRNIETMADVKQIETKSILGFPPEILTAYKAPKRKSPLRSATSTTIMTPISRAISRMSMNPKASLYSNTP